MARRKENDSQGKRRGRSLPVCVFQRADTVSSQRNADNTQRRKLPTDFLSTCLSDTGGEDVVDNLYCNTAVAKDETPDYITAMHTKTGALLQYTQAHPYIMSQTLTTDCTKARHEKLLSCTILCNRTEGCSVR